MSPLSIVWLKRDLRLHDHAALAAAARETSCGQHPTAALRARTCTRRAGDLDLQHWQWIRASLEELRDALAERGATARARGQRRRRLADLHRLRGIRSLHSHQETGLETTFARDRAVAAFCRASGIPWHQHMQFGVLRPQGNRDGWAGRWEALMAEPEATLPAQLAARS